MSRLPGKLDVVLSAAAIVLIAGSVRIAHVENLRSSSIFEIYLGDSRTYHAWAMDVADGDIIGDAVFYQAPLYPYALGLVYALFGVGRWTATIFQVLLSSCSCLMLFDGVRQMTSLRAATVAGILMACYAPAIFFDAVIQKPSLVIFFLTMVFMLLARWQQRNNRLTCYLLGAAVGCLVLCRENAILIIGAISLGMMVTTKQAGGHRNWRAVIVFLIGVSTALMPVAVRNKVVGGDFVLTTSQFGPNFYIGNGQSATGMYQPLIFGGGNAEHERSDATWLAERESGRPLNPSEVSSYWFRRAMDEIWGTPLRWLRLMGHKTLLAANRVEVTDTEDMYSYAEWSMPLRLLAPVNNFGLIFPLGMIGICLTWKDDRFMVLLLVLLSYFIGLWCFYVMSRYRLPLAPLLMVFAGISVTEGRTLWQRSSTRRRQVVVFVGLVSVGLTFWPVISSAKMQSVTQYNLAVHFDITGDTAKAVSRYKRALALNPYDADAWANLGDVLARSGRHRDAISALRSAVELAPELPVPHFWLAQCLQAVNRPDEAIVEYMHAVSLAPDLPDPYVCIGIILKQQQDLKNAEQAFRRAVEADSNFIPALGNLGTLLLETGNADEAVTCFEKALLVEPQNSAIRDMLKRSQQQLGNNASRSED